MRDTSPDAKAIQVRIHRGLTGAERLALALEMSDCARELTLARLRQAHPEWTDRELARELARYAFRGTGRTQTELPPPLR